MFSLELNGYSREEVENKITELEIENAKLQRACKEKDDINLKLASAVNKAKEIESSSQNLFKLKFQRLAILYQNLEQNFRSLTTKFPQLRNISDLKEIFDKFSRDVKEILKDEFHANLTSPVRTENDTIRLLLNKMSAYAKTKNDDIKTDSIKRSESKGIGARNSISTTASKKDEKNITPAKSIQQSYASDVSCLKDYSNDLEPNLRNKNNAATLIASQLEIESEQELRKTHSQIKPITSLTKDSESEELCDKFLKSDEDINGSAYAKMLSKRPTNELFPTPNESGFNLKEAVNPKEDLSEIMKSFHFTD